MNDNTRSLTPGGPRFGNRVTLKEVAKVYPNLRRYVHVEMLKSAGYVNHREYPKNNSGRQTTRCYWVYIGDNSEAAKDDTKLRDQNKIYDFLVEQGFSYQYAIELMVDTLCGWVDQK